jgi:hypothetical protein
MTETFCKEQIYRRNLMESDLEYGAKKRLKIVDLADNHAPVDNRIHI